MNIAVFGDLHGNILRAFKIGLHWQQQTGKQLDLMLQVGDLGVFPDQARFDRATRRHSNCTSAALGFQEYFTSYRPEVSAILNEIACPLLFVRGNHEDHVWLDAQEQRSLGPLFPVDAYARIWCLKTGIPYTFQQGDEGITILGIGRPAAAKKTKQHYIQPYEQDRLEQLGETPVDILLTHDAPCNAIYPGAGSFEIEQALWHQRPLYHFLDTIADLFAHFWEQMASLIVINCLILPSTPRDKSKRSLLTLWGYCGGIIETNMPSISQGRPERANGLVLYALFANLSNPGSSPIAQMEQNGCPSTSN